MSRGLGKWEHSIMNIVTYPNITPWVNIREIIQILMDCDNPWYPEVNGKSINEKIEFLCIHDGAYIFCRWSIQKSVAHDNEGKVLYQSLMRAIRSLEKKGFIVSQKEDMGLSDEYAEEIKEDLKEAPLTKEISFNPKCLINGIPWQLKYLNKRLTKVVGCIK